MGKGTAHAKESFVCDNGSKENSMQLLFLEKNSTHWRQLYNTSSWRKNTDNILEYISGWSLFTMLWSMYASIMFLGLRCLLWPFNIFSPCSALSQLLSRMCMESGREWRHSECSLICQWKFLLCAQDIKSACARSRDSLRNFMSEWLYSSSYNKVKAWRNQKFTIPQEYYPVNMTRHFVWCIHCECKPTTCIHYTRKE